MMFTKVGGTNTYVVPPTFRMSAEQMDRCKELFGEAFGFGWIVADELGSDGNVYQTQQLAIRLPKETDLVIFKVIISG